MSDRPQETPMSSPLGTLPSTAPQSHQEDAEMLRTAVDDLHRHLVGLIDGSKVAERKDDSSDPPLPLASRISDCCVVIQKLKANKDLHLEGSSKSTTELVEKNERYILEMQLLAKSLGKASPGYEAPKESDDLVSVFKAVRAHLKKSSEREFDLQEKVRQLEDKSRISAENLARMKEHEKLFVQLRNVEQRLKNVMPGFVSTEGNECPSIVSHIHEHLAQRQIKHSSLSGDLLIREEEKKQSDEALHSMKLKYEQAKQSTRRAEQDRETCKAELEQAKLEASRAKDAEASLASNLGKLLDRTEKVLLRTEFPRDVLFMEIPDKVGWLADEHERTCIELIVMKQDLEQANSELVKRTADLKAAELKVERLAAVENAISSIEFPTEIHPEQALDKVRWLAGGYTRLCEELGETKLNLELAKGELDKCSTDLKAAELEVERLVCKIKDIGVDDLSPKIADELLETIRAPEDETNEEGLDTETIRTGLTESYNNLKDAETSLADEGGKVLDGAKEVISRSQVPQEVISMDSAHYFKFHDDYKRTCEELGATKVRLECAKGELDKCYTHLKVAELKVEGLREIENEISLIEIPTEVNGQCLDKVKWLTGDYRRTCEELGTTKLNLEQAKRDLHTRAAELKVAEHRLGRLVSTMKANMLETIQLLEKEANEEDSNTGTSRVELAFGGGSYYDADGAVQAYMQQQAQHQAPGSAIAPHAFHHGPAYAYQHSMSYDSPAQQFGYGYYDSPPQQFGYGYYDSPPQQFGYGYYGASGLMQPNMTSTSRSSAFSRGRLYGRGRGRRWHGRGE